MIKIVCPDGTAPMKKYLTPHLERKLHELGSFIWFDGKPKTPDIYLERVGDADGVLLIWDIPDEVLNCCSKLKTIAFTGADPRKFIDLSLATSKGVAVTNTPHYGDHSVAEHAIALVLACAKRTRQLDSLMHRRTWEQNLWGTVLWGKTFGLIGLGGIGGEVAHLAQGFGMKVLCWTPHATPERAQRHGVQFVTLKDLFQQSDVVSIHLAHTPETERIISRELLELLKPEAIFVNTSRGELVDNQALLELLKENRLGAVGLDVYDVEPIEPDNPFLEMENTVLTPHVANNTPEAVANIMSISVDNLASFFSGHPQNVVNSEVLGRLGIS